MYHGGVVWAVGRLWGAFLGVWLAWFRGESGSVLRGTIWGWDGVGGVAGKFEGFVVIS